MSERNYALQLFVLIFYAKLHRLFELISFNCRLIFYKKEIKVENIEEIYLYITNH